ncbi:MAG TPA: HlyU family transcriptional regulator [Beijerinckiaceae bacterium]|jgi:hypothetical protein
MVSIFKSLWQRLAGGAGGAAQEAAFEPVEYGGYRIRPAPYAAGAGYQTAGVIEKDFPEGVKEHRFVRAETHPSRDDAITFSITKAKQIIDQQGDRIFGG